jgi:polysaccharide biosynthesis transport protein
VNSLSNPTAANGQQPSSGSGRKLAPLRSWRNHAELTIAIFLGIMILGVPVVLKKSRHRYSSEAVIVIWPRFLRNLEDDKEFELQSNTQYREFVEQNVRTVDRYDIIEEAINRLDRTPHPWRQKNESMATAVGRLRGKLSIVPIPDTYQIALRLESGTAKGLPETLNMVGSVFLEKSNQEEFYGRDQRVDSLKSETLRLSELVDTLGKEKSSIGEELGVTVFGENLINPYDRLLVESKEALAIARQKQITTASDLAAMGAHTGGKSDSAVHALAFDLAQKNPALMTLQANLNLRRTELMAKLSGMLPAHPGRAAMEREIADIDSLLKNKDDSLSQAYSEMLLVQRKAEATSAAQVEQQMQKEVDAQAVRAAQYSEGYQKGVNLSVEIQTARKRLQEIDDRLNFIALESEAPGFAHMFSPARNPATAAGGDPKRLILLLCLAAVALGLVAPLVTDLFDKRILSPNEAEAKLGFPAMGFTCLPEYGEIDVQQIRRLAAALDREATRNGSRTYLFVPANQSPNVPDLLSRVAAELRMLDHSVCILGCNISLPLPDLVLAGGYDGVVDPFRDAVTPQFGSLRQELGRAASQNEFVLLTSGPFSSDAEAELLATSSDVVVLTVKAAQTTKAELTASVKTLLRIQPKAVSLVITDYDPDPPAKPFRFIQIIRYVRSRRSSQ